jgi:hypothetical protein
LKGQSHSETWSLIEKETNSLQQYTNLNLLFEMPIEDFLDAE